MISALFVGLTAGFAAVLLKTIVHYIQFFISNNQYLKSPNYLYLLFPTVGIMLTIFIVNYFLKGKLGRGAAHVLYRISKKSSDIEKEAVYSHIITSALTVGFGGSAGLEAPIVVTGAAIGSNYGRVNLFSVKDRTLLLACGSAAGIAAVFNAPIAGVMFALEVLISEAAISAFVPLIIASATGALFSNIILQENILFSFYLRSPFNYMNVPYYLVLGVICGFISLYYAAIFRRVELLFKPFENRTYLKGIIGGAFLAFLIFLFPPLFGEGYSSIKTLADGNIVKLFNDGLFSSFINNEWIILLLIGAIVLVKAIATAITLGSGGNGGNFAPSLFVGSFLGFFFARFVNTIQLAKLPEANFLLVGMAGVLSGLMYAPLTGIFLIAEVTGGYDLMIPLMIVASISYLIARHFQPFSMDKKELAARGELITGDKDKTVLTLLNLNELIEIDFVMVKSTDTILKLTDIIVHSKRNIFPVVDSENNFLGTISFDNIREMLFELSTFKDMPAIELMESADVVINHDEEMISVMKKFDMTNAWNLPVVADGKYIGFISKSSLFTKYRSELLKDGLESD